MKVLLDTHTLLWFYLDAPQLSVVAAATIADSEHVHYVSQVSIWEIALKLSIGKLKLHEPFLDFVQHAVFDNGFHLLAVEPAHCAALMSLEHHHRDPFDRMLLAQAIIEQAAIVSIDSVFDAYPVARVW